MHSKAVQPQQSSFLTHTIFIIKLKEEVKRIENQMDTKNTAIEGELESLRAGLNDIADTAEEHLNETAYSINSNIEQVNTNVQNTISALAADVHDEINTIHNRVNSIVAQAGSDNTEIVDARTTTFSNDKQNCLSERLSLDFSALDSHIETLKNSIHQTLNDFYSVEEEKGINLFNPATMLENKTINFSGVLVTADGYVLSDYIDVKNISTLYFSYNSVPEAPTYIFTYDLNMNFIERLVGSTSYVVPQNVCYIRINTTIGKAPLYMVTDKENVTFEAFHYQKTTTLTADNILKLSNDIQSLNTNISRIESYIQNSKLYGKKLCVCGDSLTYGAYADSDQDGNRKTYAYYTAKRNNMILTVNAVSGSCITTFKEGETGGGASFTYGDEYARYKQLGENPDYITIWFGINDYTYLAKTNGIGTIDSFDKTTFYGAWNTVLSYIINTYPTAKIGIIITYGASREIRDATRAICRKYGIPPLDFMGDESIPIISDHGRDTGTVVDSTVLAKRRETFIYSGDSVHMNDAGYQYFSTIFENYLNSL